MQIHNEVIGTGLTCEVRKVTKDNCDYAIKLYKENFSQAAIKKEINILQQINHHNVIHLIEGNSDNRYLITELLQQKDLFDLLAQGKKPFKLTSIKYIILQLSAVIQYIHKSGFVHRDIKLENILLDKQLTIKLCDFGFAEPLQGGFVARSSGTLGYLAPELQVSGLINTDQLPATDVFSLGVCLFLLAFAHPPFRQSTKACPYWRLISTGQWQKYWGAVDKKNNYDDSFRSLIQGMLEPNPQMRLNIEEVLEHPFLTGGDKEEYCIEVWERMKLA